MNAAKFAGKSLLLTIFVLGQSVTVRADESAPFQRVPVVLQKWELLLSQSSRRVRHPFGVLSDGTFVESTSRTRNQRPKQLKAIDLPAMSTEVREELFGAVQGALNGFYFSNPDCNHITNDAGLLMVQLKCPGRSIRIGVAPEDVNLTGIGPQYAKIVELMNGAFNVSEEQRRGKMIRYDSEWRNVEKQGKRLADAREIVPKRLDDWIFLELGVAKGESDLVLRMWKTERFRGGTEVILYLPQGDGGSLSESVDKTDAEEKAVFDCVRLIVNELTMRDVPAERAERAAVRCTAGIETECRSIRVEFDVDNDTPAEWTSRLSAVLEMFKGKLFDSRGKPIEFPQIR